MYDGLNLVIALIIYTVYSDSVHYFVSHVYIHGPAIVTGLRCHDITYTVHVSYMYMYTIALIL